MDEEKRHTKILEIIKKRLIPDEIAKKDRGEVFTPLNMVREVMYGKKKGVPCTAKIDSDEYYNCIFGMDNEGEFADMPQSEQEGGVPFSVWRNPNSTFLDPANGIGNFPVIVFYMLDYQLGKHADGFKGPANRLKRHKHIIEKMIFMMEINKSNCNTTKKIFKLICPSAEPNVCCSNSLTVTTDQLKRAFNGVSEFDVVMGNPPFNPGPLWFKFIAKFMPHTKKYMLFIVPSAFTSNVTGIKQLEYLNENGLKLVRFLKMADWDNKIAVETLFFVTEKSYEGKVNINYLIDVNQKEPIIDFENATDANIMKRVLQYIREHGHITLFKGENKTLDHKSPVETDNIKFNKSERHKHRLLSRLGGGEHEYYWVDKYTSSDEDHAKIVFPRGTGSYNSLSNLLNVSKDMVYSTCVDKDETLSDSLLYVPLEDDADCDKMKWYLMRSKIVRYIFIKINQLAELTAFLFNYIPKIDIHDIDSDEDVYKKLDLNERDIAYLETMFTPASPKSRAKTASKKAAPSGAGNKGGRRTRRKRRV